MYWVFLFLFLFLFFFSFDMDLFIFWFGSFFFLCQILNAASDEMFFRKNHHHFFHAVVFSLSPPCSFIIRGLFFFLVLCVYTFQKLFIVITTESLIKAWNSGVICLEMDFIQKSSLSWRWNLNSRREMKRSSIIDHHWHVRWYYRPMFGQFRKLFIELHLVVYILLVFFATNEFKKKYENSELPC